MPLLASVALAACTGGDIESASGQVIAVEASSIVAWDSITVRTQEGTELTFLRGDAIDLRFWRASHLREHAQSTEPITVRYRSTKLGLVAVEIGD